MTGWPVLVGYLLGTVPFALLVGGAAVRTAGSGNLGAANVLRVRRTSLGVLVLVLDLAKGAAAIWVARAAGAEEAMVVSAGAAAIVGHIYPVWLHFRGGKGVSTTFGVLAAVSPPAALMAGALCCLGVWMTRYVSVGSLLALVSLPGLVLLSDGSRLVAAAAAGAALLVVFRHRSNLARLQRGTERKLGRGWTEDVAPSGSTRN